MHSLRRKRRPMSSSRSLDGVSARVWTSVFAQGSIAAPNGRAIKQTIGAANVHGLLLALALFFGR